MSALRVLKGYSVLQSCDDSKRLFLDNGDTIIPIDRDYYVENEKYSAEKVFVESSSSGGVVRDIEFAQMLLENYSSAKYYDLNGTEMIPYKANDDSDQMLVVGINTYVIKLRTTYDNSRIEYANVQLMHNAGTLTGEVWFSYGGGGGGGTIKLTCDREVVHPIDKKYIPSTTFYGGEISVDNHGGFLYLDKERTVQASRKDVLEAYMHSNILLEILDGPVVIPSFYDISVAIALDCHTIVDSQESLLSYYTKEMVDFMTL